MTYDIVMQTLGMCKTKKQKFQSQNLQVDLYLCRDLDSQFSDREHAAVNEWLQSNKAFHFTRDHPSHKLPIMGCCWGCKLTNLVRLQWKTIWKIAFEDKIMWKNRREYSADQTFLSR